MKPSDSSGGETPRHPGAPPAGRTLFDWPSDAGMAEIVTQAMKAEVSRRRRVRGRLLAVTALLALTATSLWTWRLAPTVRNEPAAATSMPAAPPRQVLADGSVIFLRENAEVAVDFTPAVRRVRLLRGEASFTVAKNAAWPFVVQAGAVSVRAVGTEFFVKRGEADVDVLVTEGCVAVARTSGNEVSLAAPPANEGTAVDGPGAATLVNAGRRVSVPVTAPTAWEVLLVSPVEIDQRSAWRAPTLTFARTPLREVVTAMNRYGAIRLVLEDRALDDVRLSGTIRADNIDALLELLAADYGIKAERRGEFQMGLTAGPASAGLKSRG